MPAPRPRYGQGRTYNQKSYTAWKEQVRTIWGEKRFTGQVEVRVTLHEWNDKSDVDNLLKSCLDALSGIAFEDDSLKYVRSASIRCADKKTEGFEIEVQSLNWKEI